MPRLSKRSKLLAELKALQKEIADLTSDRDVRWEVRAIHGDLDGVKHQQRATNHLIGAIAVRLGVPAGHDPLDDIVNPTDTVLDKIVSDVRGRMVDPAKPPKKRRVKKSPRGRSLRRR